MLQDREVQIDQFVKITAGGVKIADYDQVQAALVKRYKETYGSDIDLANTTADGVFVNDLALIINNILQTFKAVYANLNVDTASGVYLDNLCRLSNVSRKYATQSRAQLEITSAQAVTLASGTIFVDNSGNEWLYNGEDITIDANADAKVITVICKTFGAVEAKAGSITQTLEATYLNVAQTRDADVGRNDETDAELRARRSQSTGATGTTVLQSLVGALLDVDGIDDVQIFNNNTTTSQIMTDGTTVPAHSVYIIVREHDGVIVDDNRVADIIYNKLTPGIGTTQFAGSTSYGEDKHIVKHLNEYITWLDQTIYWKKAKPISTSFTVTITPGPTYVSTTAEDIGNSIIAYMNSLQLSQLPTTGDLTVNALYANAKTLGSYNVKSVDITSLLTTGNPNTYFTYNKATAAASGDDIVITFTYA